MGELDPHRPRDLLLLVRRMDGVGASFDFLPESAESEGDPCDADLLCLLLCDEAEPGLWDWGGGALLRPYSVPTPQGRATPRACWLS